VLSRAGIVSGALQVFMQHLDRHTLADLLPADQLQALRARVIDEREYDEIARDLDCSEAVVRKRVSRALSTLRARVNINK